MTLRALAEDHRVKSYVHTLYTLYPYKRQRGIYKRRERACETRGGEAGG